MHLREVLSSYSPRGHDPLSITESDETVTDKPDNSVVTVLSHPNRKLQSAEITELVESYVAGASIRSLGKRYGMHEQTVKAHLRRQDVEIRPVLFGVKDEDMALVVELHQAGWGARRIAARLGVGQTAVWGAIKRGQLQNTRHDDSTGIVKGSYEDYN